MNKTDFIKAVAKRQGITPQKASREVKDVMDTLRVILSSGDEVQFGGFGTFDVLARCFVLAAALTAELDTNSHIITTII